MRRRLSKLRSHCLRVKSMATGMLFSTYRTLFVRTGLNRVLDYRRIMPRKVARWASHHQRKQSIFSRWLNSHGRENLSRLKLKYREAISHLSQESSGAFIGDYLEFGVYRGTQLALMHDVLQEMRITDIRLFGFDSFEGLPAVAKEEDGGKWANADLKCDYELAREYLTLHGVDWERVHLIRGWFHDTLDDRLRQRFNLQKAGCIMIDCDLYSSAKTALNFCAPLIHDRCVIFFDEYYHREPQFSGLRMGEQRALEEFLAEHPEFQIHKLGQYSPDSQIVMVTRQMPANEDPAPHHNWLRDADDSMVR